MTWDFIDLAIFLLALVLLVPRLSNLIDWYLERKAQRERTKWRQMQDEHSTHPGAESYKGGKE